MRRERFDVVLSDVVMPEMDGYELFQAARREAPDTPVVLMTAFYYDQDHVIKRSRHRGARRRALQEAGQPRAPGEDARGAGHAGSATSFLTLKSFPSLALREPGVLPVLKHGQLVARGELDVRDVLAEVRLVLQRDAARDADGVGHGRFIAQARRRCPAPRPASAASVMRRAPLAPRSVRAASTSVAPVVATSSSKSTRRPAQRARARAKARGDVRAPSGDREPGLRRRGAGARERRLDDRRAVRARQRAGEREDRVAALAAHARDVARDRHDRVEAKLAHALGEPLDQHVERVVPRRRT